MKKNKVLLRKTKEKSYNLKENFKLGFEQSAVIQRKNEKKRV